MSSIDWTDVQVRLLIDERKQRNVEYYTTSNKKKRLFWEDIAKKINEHENTNYFTGEDCRKKFSNLTKAYKTADKYRSGEGKKQSFIGEGLYQEFSTRFWLKPELPFERMHNANVRRRASLSSAQVVTTNNPPRNTTSSSQPSKIPRPLSSSVTTASSRTASRTGIASKIPRGTPSPNRSRPTTPSVSRPTSRPVTPSFSQSAETINIFINYTEPDEQED